MTSEIAQIARLTLPNQADAIYSGIKSLPIISPHGHCAAEWFSENAPFADPAELLIIPDHYVFRMLYSQGVPLEQLGIGVAPENRNPRAIFRILAQNWMCFLGTPSRVWMEYVFRMCFGLTEPLGPANADDYYDTIDACLRSPDFRPKALFERFAIELLATTDSALDDLSAHRQISESGWQGRIIPTFRPDDVLNPAGHDFPSCIAALERITDQDCTTYAGYLDALRSRRLSFRKLGATATDHDVPSLHTKWLDPNEIEALFSKALNSDLSEQEQVRFYGHMLIEMAQMSIEDGLVMQIHAGSTRSTNRDLLHRFGRDIGADIPHAIDWVGGLEGLLNRVGNNPDLRVILFTLDEAAYARELAPMAGHWPALRLGPPWWFHDSLNGIRRYLDQVVETAGYWNLAGFNDDTRAFLSIPARHDIWRRGVALHLGEQIERGILGQSDARHIAKLLARDLAVETYKLDLG